MVWRAEKCSLRAASCCRVEVVNGAAGLRVYGLESTALTMSATSGFRSAAARDSAEARSRATASEVSVPVSSKSRPVATRLAVQARQTRFEA